MTSNARISESATHVGTGALRFRVDQQWAKLPEGWRFHDVAGIAVDSQDRVYAFNRGGHPVIVFDRNGAFLHSWGENVFTRPHGLHMGPDDLLYCTDDGDHTVRKCTLDGKVLMQIGIPGAPSPVMSGIPFNRCTHTALSPENDIYVADGYKNARVHKYSSDGKHIMSWGESGTEPGQFNIPHNISCDSAGWVYVADRENHRVQIFDGAGKYETQWSHLHRPCGLFVERGADPLGYIGEIAPMLNSNRLHPNLGASVKIVAKDGTVLLRIGGNLPGTEPGCFVSPHCIAIDSHGDIYVGEVAFTSWPFVFPNAPVPHAMQTLTKLVREPE